MRPLVWCHAPSEGVKFSVGLQLGGKRESSDFSGGNPHQSTHMSKRYLTIQGIRRLQKDYKAFQAWGVHTAGRQS